jgi:hypothetical protein
VESYEVSRAPRLQKKVAVRPKPATETVDAYPLAAGGSLFGWEAGHRVYRVAYKRLQRLPAGGVLVVDLSRVRQASQQALKEVLLIAEVLRASKFEERYVVFRVEPRNRDLSEALEEAARTGGCAVTVVSRAGNFSRFGKLTRGELETLEAIERRGELTSKRLRDEQGLLPSAASNRLRRLHHLRLIRREERAVAGSGGREFVYLPLFRRAKEKKGGR